LINKKEEILTAYLNESKQIIHKTIIYNVLAKKEHPLPLFYTKKLCKLLKIKQQKSMFKKRSLF